MKKFTSLMVAAGMVVFFALVLAASPTHARVVNCDQGGSLQDAVNTTMEGGVVEVFGTCMERVIVNKDGVEIVGVGGGEEDVQGPDAHLCTWQRMKKPVNKTGFIIKTMRQSPTLASRLPSAVWA